MHQLGAFCWRCKSDTVIIVDMHFIQVKIDVFTVVVVEVVKHEKFLSFLVEIRRVTEQVRRLLRCRVVVYISSGDM